MGDKRKTGEGAMKGWATRRQRLAAKREAISVLHDVSDEVGGMCVHGVRVTDHAGKFLVGALTLVNWRDRITSALRVLDK